MDFLQAKDILENNGVILCPTDTVWGLSGNALSSIVSEKIYNIKKRPKSKSFIILMHSIEQLKQFVDDDLTQIEDFLAQQTRPTTIIYKQIKQLPTQILSTDESIAIRIPKEKWLIDFLQSLDFPLISTSANLSGEPTPTKFSEVSTEIKRQVDFIFQEIKNKNEDKQSSQIVKFEDGQPIWLRQ